MMLNIFTKKIDTPQQDFSPNLWRLAIRRLKEDRIAMASLFILLCFFVMLVLSMTGLIAKDWNNEVAVSYAPPTFMDTDQKIIDHSKVIDQSTVNQSSNLIDYYGIQDPLAEDMKTIDQQLDGQLLDQQSELKTSLPFGADKWGQDIVLKTIKGAETSIIVGVVSALLAVIIGTFLGAIAGYFGGWVDDILNWFYNVFTSIPYLLLVLAIAAVLQQKGILSIVLILGLTGWTGVFRLIRAEYMKHTAREYVLAAKAIGVSHTRRMFVHIFPNVSHIALVQISILVVTFIKSEVILSFLGFGVPVGVVSWGSMLNEAQSELILGKWWQLVAASVAMAVLVTAFSMFTDALRDALDPKLK